MTAECGLECLTMGVKPKVNDVCEACEVHWVVRAVGKAERRQGICTDCYKKRTSLAASSRN